MSTISRSTSIIALAVLLAACPGCSWKQKNGKNSQSRPVSSAGSNVNVSGEMGDDTFEKGANRTPTPKTLYTLAQIFESQGKDDQAEPVLRKIIVDEPRFMPAYCDYAELQMRQRRIEDAYGTLTAGLKISPDQPILLNNRGMCQVLLKDYEGALANFTRATSLRPDDARYRSNMAMTLAMLGRYEESFSLYALVMPPQDARYNVALLAETCGDTDRAEEIRHGKHAKVPAKAPVLSAIPVAPAAIPTTVPAIAKVDAQPTTAPTIVKAISIKRQQPTTAPTIVKAISIKRQQPTTAPAIAIAAAIEQPTTKPAVMDIVTEDESAEGQPQADSTIAAGEAQKAPIATPSSADSQSAEEDENPS